MAPLTQVTMKLSIALPALVLCASTTLSAQGPTLTADQQIAAATLPLSADQRSTATVLGYSAGKLGTLRKGTNGMTCLAPDPKRAEFHVACYHEGMEPFMARGRELRASGVTGAQVDSARFKEVRTGALAMPKLPSALFSLTGGKFDPAAGKATGAGALSVVYIPGATTASTGITDKPVENAPWIMYPGTPKAHIMFVGSMEPAKK
jgi:hypothetical protein